MTTILSKNPDVARLAQLLLAGAATSDLIEAANPADVRAIKSDTGVMHYRAASGAPVVQKAEGDDSDPATRTYVYKSSIESRDRMGDVIRAGGWDWSDFKNNNVALYQHDPHDPIGNVVGSRKVLSESPKYIEQAIVFPQFGASPLSDTTRRLVAAGVLKGCSVGFLPILVKWPEDDAEREKLGVGRFGCVYEKQAQLELSVVSIPCHPDALLTGKSLTGERVRVAAALAKMLARGDVTKEGVDAFLDRSRWSVRKLFPVTRVVTRAAGDVPAFIEPVHRGEPVLDDARATHLALEAQNVVLEALRARADAQDKAIGELRGEVATLSRDLATQRASVTRSESPADFYGALDELALLNQLNAAL